MTDVPKFAVFDTVAGPCGLVWDQDETVAGTCLPQDDAPSVRATLRSWHPRAGEAPLPGPLRPVADGVRRLLADGDGDLTWVPLGLDGIPDFDRRVYQVVRGIPPGEVLTYGEVARRLGEPGAAQAVGRAMGRNPFPPLVPCHRVIAADRRIGGFSARGGSRTKLRMLETEGVFLEPQTLFDL